MLQTKDLRLDGHRNLYHFSTMPAQPPPPNTTKTKTTKGEASKQAIQYAWSQANHNLMCPESQPFMDRSTDGAQSVECAKFGTMPPKLCMSGSATGKKEQKSMKY